MYQEMQQQKHKSHASTHKVHKLHQKYILSSGKTVFRRVFFFLQLAAWWKAGFEKLKLTYCGTAYSLLCVYALMITICFVGNTVYCSEDFLGRALYVHFLEFLVHFLSFFVDSSARKPINNMLYSCSPLNRSWHILQDWYCPPLLEYVVRYKACGINSVWIRNGWERER